MPLHRSKEQGRHDDERRGHHRDHTHGDDLGATLVPAYRGGESQHREDHADHPYVGSGADVERRAEPFARGGAVEALEHEVHEVVWQGGPGCPL